MLKNRVAALEKKVGTDSDTRIFFICLDGVMPRRAEWNETIFERTDAESEGEFKERITQSVLAASSGGLGFHVVSPLIPASAETSPAASGTP